MLKLNEQNKSCNLNIIKRKKERMKNLYDIF